MKTEDGRAASSRRSRRTWRSWCSNSAARFRASMATGWCAARSCGRCSATTIYEAFREVKRTFDPRGIFNPGKIVDAPPMTSNLRFGAKYKAPQSARRVSIIRQYGGLGGAVEMCSGVGACRKKLAGTMCPSYMATRERSRLDARPRERVAAGDERADWAKPGWAMRASIEVLDLCLECRACKSECPVGVDMARIQERVSGGLLGAPRHAAASAARWASIANLSVWGSRVRAVVQLGPACRAR